MTSRTIFTLFLGFVAQALLCQPLKSQESMLFQEMGFFLTSISSDHVELPSPMGFGFFSRWQIADGWLFRVSYHRSKEETAKNGIVCDQYSQRINCRLEPTETSVTFSGLRARISRALRVGSLMELDFGGGVSFNHVNPEAFDLTGWPADMLVPNTGQIGYLAAVSATLAPLRSVPILLVGGFTNHWVDFNGCSGEDPPQYDPFCGVELLKELEVGLSYAF